MSVFPFAASRLPQALAASAFVLVGACSSTNGSNGLGGGDDGGTGNTGGSTGGNSGANTGGNTAGNSGGNTGGSTGGNTGGSTGNGSGSATGSATSTGVGNTVDGGSHGSGGGNDGGSSMSATQTATSTTVTCSKADAGAVSCSSNPVTQSFNAGLTFYAQTSANNCSMPWPSSSAPQSGATMYTAFSTQLYDAPSGSGSCGKCVQVNGKTLIVVDQCPSNSANTPCENANHLDLGGGATFTAVTGQSQSVGEIANSPGVNVKFVPCPVSGNLQYSFSSSTQMYYLAMVILNSKYGIQSVSFRASGATCSWTQMPARTDANANWVISSGTVPNPIDFLVTDEWGHVIEDDNIHWVAGQNVTGGSQFPTCP